MCGRYSFAPKPKQLEEAIPGLELPAQVEISFNIAPTQLAYVLSNDLPKHLQKMEWGLVPHWSMDGKNSGKLINARAEGIEEKPSFRDSIQSRRCLVPADSFYEWRQEPGGKKAPYRIFLENGALLFLAGIWDEWRQGDAFKRTFSIITTTPNLEMSTLHDRMPVILSTAETQQQWLSAIPLEKTLELLRPVPDKTLAMYRVSDKINKPGYDGPDLQEPVPEPWRLFN
jgi:putative SOS response-associated peptidase YedK